MSNPYQKCSICSTSPEVIQAVNEALRKRERFRDLAARTGFSRASLHRHSKKCIQRAALAAHKERTSSPQSSRRIVSWPNDGPDGPGFTYYGEPIAPSQLRPDDFLFCVEYRPVNPKRIKNPPIDEVKPSNETTPA